MNIKILDLFKFKVEETVKQTAQEQEKIEAQEVQDENNIWTMTIDKTGKNESIQPRTSSTTASAMEEAEKFLAIVYGDEATEAQKASAQELALKGQKNNRIQLPELNIYDPQKTYNSELGDLQQFTTKDGVKELTISLEEMLNSGQDYNKYIELKLFELYGQENQDTDNDGTATDSDFGLALAEMLKDSNPELEGEAHGKNTWESISDSIVMSAFENGEITLQVRDIGIQYANGNNKDPLKNYSDTGNYEISHIYSMADSIEIPDVDGQAMLSGESILENFEYDLEGLGKQQKENIELMILQQVAASNGLLETEEYETAKNDLDALKKLNFAQGKEIGQTLITEDVNVAVQTDVPTKVDYITKEVTKTVVNEVTKTVINDVTETVVNKVTETVVNDITETVVNKVTETVVNDVTKTVVNEVTETVVNKVTETVVNDVTKTVVNKVTETVVNEVTTTVTNTITETCTPNPVPNF